MPKPEDLALPQMGTLRDVLPVAAHSLGIEGFSHVADVSAAWGLPAARRVVVMLIDGLGFHLLRSCYGNARYLSRYADVTHRLTCDFPATTATSLGSFGTGLPPGSHGLMGYLVRDPARDVVFNELRWDDAIDPGQWQPHPTIFEAAAAQGTVVVQVGPKMFANSGMTLAALRGARFSPAEQLQERIDTAVAVCRRHNPSLVYVYWGDVDKVGHNSGWKSYNWAEEVTAIDAAVAELHRRLPKGAVLVVTSDHGMVDIPFADRIDLTDTPLLAKGVHELGGEPRAPMAYCEPGQAHAVQQRWREHFGDTAEVLTRDEAIAAGWYGEVADDVRGRIGDVVANAKTLWSMHDTRTQGDSWVTMTGMHGAMTPEEMDIPLIVLRA